MADISIIHNGSTDYYVKDAAGREALAVVENKGAKNLLKLGFTTKTVGTQTATMTADGNGIVVNGDRNSSSDIILVYDLSTNESAMPDTRYTLPVGSYVIAPTGTSTLRIQVYCHDGSGVNSERLGQASTDAVNFEYTSALKTQYPYIAYRLWASRVSSFSNLTIYPMVCSKAEWDISQAYVPYGKTNAELTTFEKQDRDGLLPVINKGAKNIVDVNNMIYDTLEKDGVTITRNGDTYTVTGIGGTSTNNFFNVYYIPNTILIPSGTWTFALIGTDLDDIRIEVYDDATGATQKGTYGETSITFTIPSGVTLSYLRICTKPGANFNTSNTAFKIMICKPSEYAISNAYVPYGITNPDLTTFTRAVANRGSKNVAEVTAVSGSAGGVDYTVNPDGTVIANRTTSSTTSTWFRLNPSLSLKAGTYILSGGKSANERLLVSPTATLADAIADSQGSEVTFTLNQDTDNLIYAIRIAYTDSPSNVKFYPMIRPAEILDSTYQPFSRTNRELTVLTDEDRDALVELVDGGSKNKLLCNQIGVSGTFGTEILTNGVRFTLNADGTITANRESTSSSNAVVALALNNASVDVKNLCDGLHILSGCPSGGAVNTYRLYVAKGSYAVYDTGTGAVLSDTTENTVSVLIVVSKDYNIQNLIFHPMICTKAAWDISHTYVPYAKTNRELTVLTDEDRASLVEIVDGGAKNLLKNELGSGTKSGLAYTTGTDGSIVITAGTPTANADFVIPFTPTKTGQYVLQGCPSGGSGTTFKGQITLYPAMTNVVEIFDDTSVTATLTGGTQYAYRFRVYSGKAIGNVTIYPMVCSKAAWDISHQYEPYARTNRDLTVLTDEDRAALVELVDNGFKSIFDCKSDSKTVNTVVFTNNGDNTFTVNGTNNGTEEKNVYTDIITNQTSLYNTRYSLPVGSYHIIGTGAEKLAFQVYAHNGSDQNTKLVQTSGIYETGADFIIDGSLPYISVRLTMFPGGSYENVKIKCMICTTTAWKISQSFQPYRPSWQEMYDSNKLIDISSEITTVSGYTLESTTHLYYKNKQVFGTIAIAIDSGSYSSSLTAIAKLPVKYAPAQQYLGSCGFSTDQWAITNIGYAFIQTANASSTAQRGQISVKSPTANLTHMILNVCYPTAT